MILRTKVSQHRTVVLLGSLLTLGSCAAMDRYSIVDLAKSNRIVRHVQVVGCIVADPMAFAGDHAFLTTACDARISGWIPEEFLKQSIDLSPVESASGTFKGVVGCYMVTGGFTPYGADLMNEQQVVPSGSLVSPYGVIDVSSLERLSSEHCEFNSQLGDFPEPWWEETPD